MISKSNLLLALYLLVVPFTVIDAFTPGKSASLSSSPTVSSSPSASSYRLSPPWLQNQRNAQIWSEKVKIKTSQLHASLAEAADLQEESSIEPTKHSSQKEPLPPSPPQNDDSELTPQQKLINAAFLAVAFGYALYTILNIDHGMTRGWTAGEIAMRVPLDNWGAYESYLANKPIITKTLINVIIYLLGDWLSQTTFQGKNVLDFDISRTLKNGLIGLCFGPLVHEYYQFSDSILPPENGLVTRLQKIMMDQTLYLSVKCSIYISAVGLLGGDDWETVQQTVKDKIGGVVITAWKFWPLIHCITYGLVPARHRILWVNSVDLVWNAILATQAQKETVPDEETDDTSASGTIEEQQPLLAVCEPASKDDNVVVVLDNAKFISDESNPVVELLTNNNNNNPGTNMTAEAVAA